MHAKRIGLIVVSGLLFLLLIPILPEVALAAGPEISDVDVEDITFTTATITWTTNTTSDSRVNYGTDKPKDASWNSTYDSDPLNFHSIRLEGLTPDQLYYFEVQSTDGSGTATDNNSNEYYSFKTLAWYSISLSPIAGSCGEEITVTATVATPGTYGISWDSLTAVQETFQATEAGSHEVAFVPPDATKGNHKVYLVDSTGTQKGEANFEITPSVQIDPDEGPVGTVVTLSGCGFQASKSIQAKFNDTVIQTTQTTATGSWPATSYTIPETPAGDCSFVVEVDGSPWASEVFKVTPKITAPSSGTVGHTIEVRGTGFQSNEKGIKVTFDGEAGKTNTPIVANTNGSWTATIVIPLVPRGPHAIDASGEKTSASAVPDIEGFIVGAGLLVETPGPYYVGDSVTVAGGGFATGETGIKVSFGGQIVASGIKAKEDGTWRSPFVLPASAYGSHNVEASGDITMPAVTASLNIQARILGISPSSGAPGDAVSITGDGFGSSQQLTVTIGGVAASGNLVTQSNGNVVISFQVPKGSVEGRQTLVVSDGSGATDDDYFTVTKKTLSTTPLPISPKGGTLRSGEVTFNWQGVAGSTGYTYTLEIGDNANSGSIWSKAGIEETSYTLTDTETVTQTLPKGDYYWRVKIVDDYGNESAWSERIDFRVSPIPIWVWVIVGVVVLIVLMYVAYRETKFKVTE